MIKVNQSAAPEWLRDIDEMPHSHEGIPPAWAENYVTYVWCPETSIGIYMHLCCRPGSPTVWDEQFVVALPDDRYLASKGIARGRTEGNAHYISGVSYHVEEPYQKVIKRFIGGVRPMSGEEYRSGRLTDGKHLPLEMELVMDAISPPYDLGSSKLHQDWGTGHFQQHHKMSGWLMIDGERHEINGSGLRDHGWGPRYYSKIGYTTWLQGQFPSGRSFQAICVTGRPPTPEFTYACISDSNSVTQVGVTGLRSAKTLEEAVTSTEIQLTMPDGSLSIIKGTVLNPLRTGLIEPSEIAIGTYSAPEINHYNIDAFTRLDWDGEIGYGITQRTVDLMVDS